MVQDFCCFLLSTTQLWILKQLSVCMASMYIFQNVVFFALCRRTAGILICALKLSSEIKYHILPSIRWRIPIVTSIVYLET
jgi:hypothetical protein